MPPPNMPLHRPSTAGCILLLLVGGAHAMLPYNPIYAFQSSASSSSDPQYFIVEPPSSAHTSGRLLSFDLSSNITTDSLTTSTLSSSLPFLGSGTAVSYTAASLPDGSILVYAGDCSASASESSVWRYADGSWSQTALTVQDPSQSGAPFLAASTTFAYNVSQAGSMYLFGGMCPDSGANSSNWNADASYSNSLVTFAPSSDGYSSSSESEQPTPEAGLTITPLLPTFSNQSDGTTTQQQTFVLIGGQTSGAFIGTSTIALLSLPQSSWSFPAVSISASGRRLRKRQAMTMEPRSGHSAILSTDGMRVIVFGGWVGDVSTPAQPQLAFLEVGGGFGGSSSSSWAWTTSSLSPFDLGLGIYGHTATMLPGGIMMVLGGYSIVNDTAAAQTPNAQNFFFNTTSEQWITSYSIETSGSAGGLAQADHAKGGLSSQEKAGLGAGLGVGLVVLIGVVLLSLFYYRKLKRQRRERADELWDGHEKEIDQLAVAGGASHNDTAGGWHTDSQMTRIPPGRHHGSSFDGDDMRGAARSGLFVDVPSPQRGLRRSMVGRGGYQSAARNEDGWQGDMQAIQERDEEISNPSSSRKVSNTRGAPAPMLSREASNPFLDPEPALGLMTDDITYSGHARAKAPQSSYAKVDAEQDAHEWFSSGNGQRRPLKSGRSSPSKSARTRSDLSERSIQSSMSMGGAGPSRQVSSGSGMRSYLPSILPGGLFNTFATSAGSSPTYSNHRPNSSGSSGPADVAPSFVTAKTTFSQLQAESEALLGTGVPYQTSPNGPRPSIAPDTEPTFFLPRARGPGRQISPRRASVVGWVGSVRRVGRAITGGRTVSLTTDATRNIPRPSVIGADGFYEPAPNISPMRSDLGGLIDFGPGPESARNRRERVRRSVSEGASTMPGAARRRHWDSGDVPASFNDTYRSLVPNNPDTRPGSSGRSMRSAGQSSWSDEDYDVEAAVEQRVVQVLYTVPRERLRVVNADIDARSIGSVPDDNGTGTRSG